MMISMIITRMSRYARYEIIRALFSWGCPPATYINNDEIYQIVKISSRQFTENQKAADMSLFLHVKKHCPNICREWLFYFE